MSDIFNSNEAVLRGLNNRFEIDKKQQQKHSCRAIETFLYFKRGAIFRRQWIRTKNRKPQK